MTHQSPKILIYNPNHAQRYEAYLREKGCRNLATASDPEEAAAQLPGTEIVFGWRFPTELLSQEISSDVRWFQAMGAGVEDLMKDISIPRFITITRVVDQFGAPIAEYIFATLLYIIKDIAKMVRAQLQEQWLPFVPDTLVGKRMGVAGLGSIGTEVVRRARSFDMNVDGLSYSGKQDSLVDRHYTPHQWKEFVQELDVLVLSLPLTSETDAVMNKDILYCMKPDSILINIGRGKLIREKDLIEVLKAGHLRAAILDVFEKEPLPGDSPLWHLPNVFISSHLSGPSTPEGVGNYFLKNLERYFAQQPLDGVVSRDLGY